MSNNTSRLIFLVSVSHLNKAFFSLRHNKKINNCSYSSHVQDNCTQDVVVIMFTNLVCNAYMRFVTGERIPNAFVHATLIKIFEAKIMSEISRRKNQLKFCCKACVCLLITQIFMNRELVMQKIG